MFPHAIVKTQHARARRVQGKERKRLLEEKGKLRVRTDRGTLADLYEKIYRRVPHDGTTVEYMAKEFSDKEIRVLMSMNKMRINNFNSNTGKYTEKTKHDKIKCLIPILHKLSPPEQIRKRRGALPPRRRGVTQKASPQTRKTDAHKQRVIDSINLASESEDDSNSEENDESHNAESHQQGSAAVVPFSHEQTRRNESDSDGVLSFCSPEDMYEQEAAARDIAALTGSTVPEIVVSTGSHDEAECSAGADALWAALCDASVVKDEIKEHEDVVKDEIKEHEAVNV
eukprot:SAG11_NODE_219_length_12168_cov_5.600083_9_plen_285_part_00